MSGDPWRHQNKEWQETLALAKAHGWPEPRVGTNHHTLVLSCPAGVHKTVIFSTGRSSDLTCCIGLVPRIGLDRVDDGAGLGCGLGLDGVKRAVDLQGR